MKKRIIALLFIVLSFLLAFSASAGTVTPPSRVSITRIANLGRGRQKVCWSKSNRATGYKIYCKTNAPGSTYKKIKTITSGSTLSYVVFNRKPGVRYYYKVRAYRKLSAKGKTYYAKYSKPVSKVVPVPTVGNPTSIIVNPDIGTEVQKGFRQGTEYLVSGFLLFYKSTGCKRYGNGYC